VGFVSLCAFVVKKINHKSTKGTKNTQRKEHIIADGQYSMVMPSKMETREQNKELLSGHLLSAHECSEEAALPGECAPQDEVAESGLDSGTFLDSAFYSPETILPPTFWRQNSDSDEEEIEPKIPRAARRIETKRIEQDEEPPHSTHWIGLVASVSVGVVIAFFLFPMIRYAERSTRSYVAESWVGEINRRVGQYEQIYGNQPNATDTEEMQPINLALSGWQELHSEAFSLSADSLSANIAGKYLAECVSLEQSGTGEVAGHAVAGNMSIDADGLLAGFFDGWAESILPDTSGLSDHTLLIMPGQANGARSAFGQGILLKDGRVFVRIVPGTEPAAK